MDEEVVLLEEQLASAHADIERLQSRLTEAEAKAGQSDSAAAALAEQLRQKEESIAELTAAVTESRSAVASSKAEAGELLQRLRAAVLASEPDLPSDLCRR